MLKLLLSVIRTVIVSLMDRLLRDLSATVAG